MPTATGRMEILCWQVVVFRMFATKCLHSSFCDDHHRVRSHFLRSFRIWHRELPDRALGTTKRETNNESAGKQPKHEQFATIIDVGAAGK